MAIEQAQIAKYTGLGNQNLSILYYAHKSDEQGAKGPAGTVLEQEVRLLIGDEVMYKHELSTVYPRDDIFAIVKKDVESWKPNQLGLEQVKDKLGDLETKLMKS